MLSQSRLVNIGFFMKENIHPKYQKIAFHDTSIDECFIVGSTLQTNELVELWGKSYPYYPIEGSSKSHSFYTGKQGAKKQGGRVSKFNNRFGKIKSKESKWKY